ncbi:MAG: formate dehydrogenase accessory sulfurtransferase FdhD [Gemmatimonadales bacterium]
MAERDVVAAGAGLNRLGYVAPIEQWPAQRWTGAVVAETVEPVAEEVPVALIYNGVSHLVMMATPDHLEDFALGFSYTEGLIESADEIRGVTVVRFSQGIELQVDVAEERMAAIQARGRRLTGRTGCGICGAEAFRDVVREVRPVPEGQPVSGAALAAAFAALDQGQPLNAVAGAVHAAGWARLDGTLELVREDVGRHNALDKLIGAVLEQGTDPASGFVVVTSRASFEMAQKAARFGTPVLAAISAPTGLAIRVAEQAGMTLVGFARGNRRTVYTGAARIVA